MTAPGASAFQVSAVRPSAIGDWVLAADGYLGEVNLSGVEPQRSAMDLAA